MENDQAGQAIVDAGLAPAPETTETPETPVPPPPPKGPSLSETIRAAREEREQRSRAEQERNDYKSRAERAEAALEAAKKVIDPRKDALAWARSQKLSPEEQAEFGQTLLYDLVPEKAPPNFRVKLLESRIERQERERNEADAKRLEQAQAAANQQLITDYQAGVQQAARSFAEGSHPESEAWFGTDRDAWAQSLLATAKNMAQSAAQARQQVDISPANVARVLEADIAERQARRDQAKGSKPNGTAGGGNPTPGAELSANAGNPTSTKGLSAGGPRGPALTEKERIERAIAAGFKTNR